MGHDAKNADRRFRHAERKAVEEFVPPASFEAAEKEVEALRMEIRSIEESLRDHRLEAGPEADTPARRDWRSRTKYALTRKLARLRLLKTWIADERNKIRAGLIGGEPLDPRDSRSLVRAAFVLLREWARQRAQVRDEEWAVLNALERYTLTK